MVASAQPLKQMWFKKWRENRQKLIALADLDVLGTFTESLITLARRSEAMEINLARSDAEVLRQYGRLLTLVLKTDDYILELRNWKPDGTEKGPDTRGNVPGHSKGTVYLGSTPEEIEEIQRSKSHGYGQGEIRAAGGTAKK